MPKLSIIIPVYNAEKYILRCLQSIEKQPFSVIGGGIEVLLVNDGSTDGSQDICEEYAKSHPQVRVFNKPNGGVSSARNMGLDNAQGDYVTFVDADDWLEENVLTETLLDGDYDLVKIPRSSGSRHRTYSEDVFITDRKAARRFMTENYNHECVAKFYRRSAINGLRFREGLRVGEDVVFVTDVFERIGSLHVVSGTKGYYYFHHEESAMAQLSEQTDYDILQNELVKRAKQHRNPIAWHFLGTHLYINAQTGTMNKLMEQLSVWNILTAPVPFSKKKEFLTFKLKTQK